MLFLSRLVHVGGVQDSDGNTQPAYGVVDTDDGIESIVDYSDLCDIIRDFGFDIKGVYTKTININVCETHLFLDYAVPYQPLNDVTQLQAKTSMLTKVRITTWRDMITNIKFDEDACSCRASIRLSDFGNKVADYVFNNTMPVRKHAVTLVLDNRLDFTKWSFSSGLRGYPGVEVQGVVYDIRELSDDKAAIIYKRLYQDKISIFDIRKSLIDSNLRYIGMMRKLKGCLA